MSICLRAMAATATLMGAVIVVGSKLVACGGNEIRRDAKALCSVPRPVTATGAARPMRATDWMNLLLKGFSWKRDPQQRLAYKAHYDCTGEPIRWPKSPPNCPQEPPDEPHVVELEEGSVIDRRLPSGEQLVWIVTHRFPNGDGMGPIALANVGDKSVSVRALGHYRGRAGRVRMHLWPIGDGSVLVVVGERCKDVKKPATCQREARVLVRDRDRFLVTPIVDREGRCIEQAKIEYKRQGETSIESGHVRRFSFDASVGHDVRYLVITEQIDINDFDPSQPGMPPRHVRRVDTERFIHLEGVRLVSRQGPLWRRMMPTRGFTELADDTRAAEQ